MMGPPSQYQYDKIKPPKSPKDLFRFMRELMGGFFGRLLYVFQLVWESGPLFLFLMIIHQQLKDFYSFFCFCATKAGIRPKAGRKLPVSAGCNYCLGPKSM